MHNVQSICISIQSMLTSNTKPERPPGDDDFCRRVGGAGADGRGFRGKVGDLGFVYEDDTV